MEKMKAITAIVTGRVHGVGFRYTARQMALNLGLVGWVRNRPDGTVEAWAQGTPDVVAQFSSFLEQGPRPARVTSVDIIDVEPDHTLDAFEVRP